MLRLQCFTLAAVLITSLTAAPPIYSSDTLVHPQLNHGDDEEAPFLASDNPDFDFENEDALANDIKNLRKLDALIGRAELAAMTNEEVNIEDDLPEIEEELKSIDAVELVNPDKQFFDVADDLRHRSKEFSVVALPYNFAKYDSNNDGFITPSELAHLTETKLKDSIMPFERADRNGDGLLTPEEFHRAPWKFDLKHKRHAEE